MLYAGMRFLYGPTRSDARTSVPFRSHPRYYSPLAPRRRMYDYLLRLHVNASERIRRSSVCLRAHSRTCVRACAATRERHGTRGISKCTGALSLSLSGARNNAKSHGCVCTVVHEREAQRAPVNIRAIAALQKP